MSEQPRNDASFDSCQQPPSYNEATVDMRPEASQDGAPPPPSHDEATLYTPPNASGDASLQSDSFHDATIDAPPESSDATFRFSMDDEHTYVKDLGDLEADDDSYLLEDRGPVDGRPVNVIANYEILGVLGRGAVGVVYKARQIGLNRLVALKMLLAGSHAGQRELMRFRTEAEAVARLRHPNIVQVYEVGEHDGLPFFSLEFIEGGSLHQKMGGKPLPPREAAEMVEALARAMHYAHERNIIHRDLKPANILISSDGVPKITDFGLAKRLEQNDESSKTRTGTLMGTPSYMSPEQAAGRTYDIGPLSDQYALGAILYEALTGRPPFLGATLLETIQQVRTQEPVRPTLLQPTTPHDLEVICLKSLQKEQSKRYANAKEMADDLRRFRNGEPIRARPVSLLERSWRWCRRNRRLAVLYAAVSILLLMLALSGVLHSVRSLREQQAIARVRVRVDERMDLAARAISGGDILRAKALLQWSDPLLDSASDLSEQRDRWSKLEESVNNYAQCKDLLDKALFAYIFGLKSSDKQMEQGREYCRELLALYDAIEQKQVPWPDLNDEQQQLFKDNVFDMFLVSAFIESDLAKDAGSDQQRQAAQQAIDWLNRADQILPRMKTLYTHRSGFHFSLGNREAADADLKLAKSIQPESAVDHFWHGYAEHVRGEGARSRGEVAKARDHYRQEIAEYAALLQQHPDHFWGWLSWAIAKMQLGDLQDALIGFTKCIQLRPDFSWPYNNRATAHLRLEHYDQAIRDYTAALERDPNYVSARSDRAVAYLKQNNINQVIQAISASVTSAGSPYSILSLFGAVAYPRQNNIDQALQDCNQVLQQDPRYAAAYLHRAECYLRRKQYEDALSDCLSVLKRNEYREDVHLKRVAIYEDMKREGDQLRYKRAVDADRKEALKFYYRANQHASRGEYQQALADYTVTLELFPHGFEPTCQRALLYWLHLKDFDAALSDSRDLVKVWPKKTEGYLYLGLIHLGRRQYSLALEELEDALSRQPDNLQALWGKAQIYLWQGKAKEALELINPVVEKLPAGDATVLNLRGDIYRYLGQLDSAAKDYRRLIELRPENLDCYVSLALVYSKQGEPGKARQCLDQMVQANPKSAAAYLWRGRFLRDQGLFEEAWKDSEQAARCDPASVLPKLLQASITAARGDAAAAVATAEQVLSNATQKEKEDGQVLYAAAQVWSLASLAAGRVGDSETAKGYADQAVKMLEQTLDKGFHDLNYPDHNRMIDDPALEAIRQHPKAMELLAHRPR